MISSGQASRQSTTPSVSVSKKSSSPGQISTTLHAASPSSFAQFGISTSSGPVTATPVPLIPERITSEILKVPAATSGTNVKLTSTPSPSGSEAPEISNATTSSASEDVVPRSLDAPVRVAPETWNWNPYISTLLL